MATRLNDLAPIYLILLSTTGLCQQSSAFNIEPIVISGSFDELYRSRIYGEDGMDTLLYKSPFGLITAALDYQKGMLINVKEFFSTGEMYREFNFKDGLL